MQASIEQLTKLFKDELVLCGVKPGEKVVVASQSESRPGYKDAFMAAVGFLGAQPLSIEFPGIRHADLPFRNRELMNIDNYITMQPYAMETLKQADMVIDITAEGLVHTKARKITLEGGARMLMVWEPPDVLERMFSRPSLRRRVEAAGKLIRKAKTMRVVSEVGTDVTVTLKENMPLIQQYGYTDQPGRWDHFAGGFVAFYPVDGSAQGQIVLDVGDVLLPLNRYVSSPIQITIHKGYITNIRGEGLDTLLFKQYFEVWKDKEVYATSHFGFGLDETALWEALAFYGNNTYGMDARAFAGNFMWSTGPNAHVGRHTQCHYDIPMRNCTVYLDDHRIIDSGQIVEPALKP
jgi:2,5-dihydroxypyridine 5,6-dioxygenase